MTASSPTGISAHDAIASSLCAHANCPHEADPRSSFCREHAGEPSERRLALAAEVRRHRDAGLTHREIAAQLGISRSYAASLDTDPDGSAQKTRKDKYRRPCPDCGAPMGGSNGHGPDAPERCAACSTLAQHTERYWTAETIVAAFRRFHEANGRSPAAADRMIRVPSLRAALSPERIAEAEDALENAALPLPSIVSRECGSWANALRLAGLPANPTGGAGHRAPRRSQRSHVKDYLILASQDGDTWTEIGQAAARTPAEAVAQVAGSADLEYVAVPVSAWMPVRVQPVTRFEVVATA